MILEYLFNLLVVNRFCMPAGIYYSNLSSLTSGIEGTGGDRITQWIADLQTTWQIILATLGIAIVLGY